MPEMVCNACICCYNTCDFDNILILCNGGGTCICCEEKCCLAANVDSFEIGMIKQDGFICKLGLPCCTCGLKMPDMADLLSAEGQCLCVKAMAQFPFGDKIKEPVCSVCFIMCMPKMGKIMAPPDGGAPPSGTTMER